MNTHNSIPSELALRIEEGRMALLSHPRYDLTLRYRFRILSYFGPRFRGDLYWEIPQEEREAWVHTSEAAILGWRRRLWNGIYSVRYVIPHWENYFPSELYVNQSLKDIEKCEIETRFSCRTIASQKVVDKDNEFEMQESSNFKELRTTLSPLYRARSVIFATRQLLGCLEHDIEQDFDAALSYENEEAYDGDPWMLDTAYWASWAYAGSNHEPGTDDAARLEYWQWWLDEAVPKSWNLQR